MPRKKYLNLCSKCASENHSLKYVPFDWGGGIKETYIDGKHAAGILASPSSRVKCAECGEKLREYYRIEMEVR